MARTDRWLRHAWLRALGRKEMPVSIRLADGEYQHVRTFKHDFFAATGLYAGSSGKVILKLGRLGWLSRVGRMLADRETRLYRAVQDVPGVPECLGRWGRTGFIHRFVEGHPLQRHERVDDEFFPRLEAIIKELHGRGMAYVDLEKRENILVGDDGRPYVIDFQISWQWPMNHEPRRGVQRLIPPALGQFILARLQDGDRYHLLKHRRRHRPDTLTPEQYAKSYRPGPFGKLHRLFFRPLTLLRRLILKSLTGRWRSPKQDGPEYS